MTVISLIWTVLCAVASGLFSEVVFKLQEDNWDDSTDKRIEWRYQHAQAALVRAFHYICCYSIDVRIRNFGMTKETFIFMFSMFELSPADIGFSFPKNEREL